jgi:hypothetical protein
METINTKLVRVHGSPFRKLHFFQIKISNMKHTITPLFLFFCINVSAQLNKGTWLVGGSGSFKSSATESYGTGYSQTSDRLEIAISPNVGYFVMDKLALGLKTSFTKHKEEVDGPGGLYTNTNRFYVGPFARYYFLEKEKQFNLLADIGYQYVRVNFKPIIKVDITNFNAAVGPVIYFNTTVGLEFLVGYYSTKETRKQSGGDYTNKQSGLQMSIGFQIHLEN